MRDTSPPDTTTRDRILVAAIGVFGRLGYKRTSVEDLARAADLSKQGLYLHFSSKQEIFAEALHRYLDDGIALVENALASIDITLSERIIRALDAWFGRHFDTFAPASFDVMEAQIRLNLGAEIDRYKVALKRRLAAALAASPEFKHRGNRCSPAEIAEALFICGLSWKERHASRADFMKTMRLCVRALCQLKAPR